MSTVRDLHNQATSIMHRADALFASGDIDNAREQFKMACEIEIEAASKISIDPENEPTRSILYLSAASLAWRATEYALAERLIGHGIAGYPSECVRKDFYKLLDQVKYDLMCLKQGEFREEATLNVRLYGGHIRQGIAPLGIIKKRLDGISNIFAKTEQRLAKRPYTDGRKTIRNHSPYELSVEWAEAASFGVNIRLSHAIESQISFQGTRPGVQDIVDDVMQNMDRLNSGDFDSLEESISDKSYLTNFIAHAKIIAPDGDRVRSVGLSTGKKSLLLNLTKKKINDYILNDGESTDAFDKGERGTITGYLDIADRKKNVFILTDLNGVPHTTQVQSGLEDLAREYFGILVDVNYETDKRNVILIDISSSESND